MLSIFYLYDCKRTSEFLFSYAEVLMLAVSNSITSSLDQQYFLSLFIIQSFRYFWRGAFAGDLGVEFSVGGGGLWQAVVPATNGKDVSHLSLYTNAVTSIRHHYGLSRQLGTALTCRITLNGLFCLRNFYTGGQGATEVQQSGFERCKRGFWLPRTSLSERHKGTEISL